MIDPAADNQPDVRKYPYPYRSMLTICSDLDETPSAHEYFSISKFLNTRLATPIGTGVGLELGNTIYFDMPDDQFAYWNTDSRSRDMIHALIRSGHIDCFHSFGDLAASREDAARSLRALESNDCRMAIWVDHAQAPTNFGPDIMYGKGDIVGDQCFHADLTVNHGLKYIWTGRVSSLIGQDTRYRLFDMLNSSFPLSSSRTALKDVTKRVLATAKHSRFRMHRKNRLVRRAKLRSGHELIEFMRCDPHPGGISAGDTSRGIAEVLTPRYLDRLVLSRGSTIIYTHLGKGLVPGRIFAEETTRAFEQLASYVADGRILVTTTKKLLDYTVARSAVKIETEKRHGIDVVSVQLPDRGAAEGITIYWGPMKPEVYVNGELQSDIQFNPADETGRRSISIPWRKLEWGL